MRKKCLICQDDGDHSTLVVREMYFGAREEFTYFECNACRTLQIVEIPADLARHYPSNYYSYSAAGKATSPLEMGLRRLRTDAWLGHGASLAGKLLAAASKRKPNYLDWFRGLGVSTASSLLDVGCGGGQLLLKLQRDGFTRLKGIDPYLTQPVFHGPSLTIANHGLEDEAGTYDLIMLHHSLEHMPDPRSALTQARDCLADGGHILVRMPVTGGFAWRKYREHWYAIDAPRHLFIPSPRGMHLLTEQLGLSIKRRFYDSDSAQFLASEHYVNDVSMVAQVNYPMPEQSRMRSIEAFVDTLNQIGDGDCCGFVLGKR